MKSFTSIVVSILVLVTVIILGASLFVVSETEQVIITQFGNPIGEPVSTSGLHLKIPFVQKLNRIEKRILEWDGIPTDMPTKDKLYISVDTFARWRIVDRSLLRSTPRNNRTSPESLSTRT